MVTEHVSEAPKQRQNAGFICKIVAAALLMFTPLQTRIRGLKVLETSGTSSKKKSDDNIVQTTESVQAMT